MKAKTAFGVFLLLLLCSIPSVDLAVSVVPGLHTPVLSPYAILTIAPRIGLLFTTLTYGLLALLYKNINRIIFLIHALVCLPLVCARFIPIPWNYAYYSLILQNILFATGFILFTVYFARMIRRL